MSEQEIPKITVSMDKFKKVYKAIKETKVKEVTFEYIIASLFPDIANNIKEELKLQYTLGYAAGLKANEENKTED